MAQNSARSGHERNLLPTLSRLSDDEIDYIWSSVSCFIEKQMLLRKGVCIFGLGTFTLSQQKLSLGHKQLLTQRPVFILSEKLSRHYGLKQSRPPATDVPVVPLNFSALSAEGPMDRAVLEGCVRETLLLMLRSSAGSQPVLLSFPGLGRLSLRNGRVRMVFSRAFLSALDGSGRLSAAPERPDRSRARASERPVSSSVPTPAGAALRTEPADPEDGQDTRPAADGQTDLRDQSPTHTDLTEESPTHTDLRDQSPTHTDRDEVCAPAGGAVGLGTPDRRPADASLTCADHRRAGQELCYLCMQRAQRNLAFSRAEESRRAEQQQERIIIQYQHQRDLLYFQREEEGRWRRRADGQRVAAFNLGVAEAQRRRTAVDQSHGSCVLACRPITADGRPQRRLRMEQMMEQMKEAGGRRRAQTQTQTQAEQQRLERLDQLRLSEELALERSQQLHEKHQMAKMYRKALEQQKELRSHTAPHTPDTHTHTHSVFGLMDGHPAALAERRRRAQQISEELMDTADRRRKEGMRKSSDEQKREREMMLRDRREMREERICHYEKQRRMKDECEESWKNSSNIRRQREQEEKTSRRSAGLTLIDQLGRYERCSLCKRNTSACGRTNIFRDTNFVSGSRLML